MSLKTEKSPSVFGVYFFASLMTLLGLALGFVYMASFPAQAFPGQQEYAASLVENEGAASAPMPGDAYYIEGAVQRTASWQAKRAQLQATGSQTVRLSAGEINAWMVARFRPGPTPGEDEKASILIAPSVPNVAITEAGVISFNLPTKLTTLGKSHDLIVFARGVPAGTGFRFETVHLNSAKVPLPDLLGRRVLETLLQGFKATEDYKILSDAFARVESIAIDNGELVLVLR